MMTELIFFFIGVGFFLVVLHFVNRSSAKNGRKKKQSRDPFNPKPIEIRAATIADDMVPLFTPLASSGVTITIIGCDGCYIRSENGYALLNGIEAWLKKGASVEYILIDSDGETLENLSGLSRRFPASFWVWDLSNAWIDGSESTSDIADVLRKYETYHPVLIKRRSDMAMWVEAFHPRGSVFAYDVVFTSPKAMDAHSCREFEDFEREFRILKDVVSPVDFTKRKVDKVAA